MTPKHKALEVKKEEYLVHKLDKLKTMQSSPSFRRKAKKDAHKYLNDIGDRFTKFHKESTN